MFLQKAREGEREGEKHHCVVASHVPPTGDLAHNPGMGPDWESNWGPFGLQASAQSTEPHQPGLNLIFHTPGFVSCFSLTPATACQEETEANVNLLLLCRGTHGWCFSCRSCSISMVGKGACNPSPSPTLGAFYLYVYFKHRIAQKLFGE